MKASNIIAAIQSLKDAMIFLGLPTQFPKEASVDTFIRRHAPPQLKLSRSLDLGCGNFPRNPFGAERTNGIDIIDPPGHVDVICSDLIHQPIPYQDGTFGAVTAFDFIEHVPRTVFESGRSRLPFVELMNEIHRVLAPEGLFFCRVPAFPSTYAFKDPTHVNFITEDTFPEYFCFTGGPPYAAAYGFTGEFHLVSQAWCDRWLLTLLRKG